MLSPYSPGTPNASYISLFLFDHPDNAWWKLQITKLLPMHFSPFSCPSHPFSHRYNPEPPSSELTDLKEGCEEDLNRVKACTAVFALPCLWTQRFGVLCHVRNRKQDRYFCMRIDLTVCSRFKWR